MLDRRWETDTVLEQDRYGSMIYDVMDQKLTFSSVVTMVGVNTTVDIPRMFLLLATAVSVVMYIMSSQSALHFCTVLAKKQQENKILGFL